MFCVEVTGHREDEIVPKDSTASGLWVILPKNRVYVPFSAKNKWEPTSELDSMRTP